MKNILIASLLVAGTLSAQTELRVEQPGPPPPESVSVSLVGAPGSTSYCYWVVAIYPVGKSEPRGACLNNAPPLSVSRYVRVNWAAAPGATGYDVVRSTRADNFSSGAFAVVANTSAQTVNDQGGALSAYTIATARAVTATLKVNNRDYATAQVESSHPLRAPAFIGDGSGLTGISGGGGSGLLLFAPTSASGATYSGAVTGATYANGLAIVFVPDVTNSGTAPAINLNAQGNRTLYRRSGNALTVSQLVPGRPYPIIYESGAFYFAEQDYAGDGVSTEVDYSTSPPQLKLNSTVCRTTDACEPTGLQDHSGASGWLPPTVTVAGLPAAAGVAGQVFMVTDAASLTSLGAGGGATRAWFVSNGTAYVALAGSGGAGSSQTTLLYQLENGPDVPGTGAAQTLATYTIPGGTLQAGDVLRVEAIFQLVGSLTGSAPNLEIKFAGGGFPGFGFTVADWAKYEAEFLVTGSTAVVGSGIVHRAGVGPALITELGGTYTAPTTFDVSTTNVISAATTAPAIDVADTYKMRYFRVYRIRF